MRVVPPVVTLAALVGGILPAAAAPELTVEYSADFTIETAEMVQTGKIYAAPGKERRESFVEGMTSVFIRRDDLGKTWMLMPAQRMYMEIKAGDESQAGSAGTDPDDYEVEMTVVGPEELDGMMTTKYKVIMTASDGGKMGGFWWITEQAGPQQPGDCCTAHRPVRDSARLCGNGARDGRGVRQRHARHSIR
jgi:hypothetical protein